MKNPFKGRPVVLVDDDDAAIAKAEETIATEIQTREKHAPGCGELLTGVCRCGHGGRWESTWPSRRLK